MGIPGIAADDFAGRALAELVNGVLDDAGLLVVDRAMRVLWALGSLPAPPLGGAGDADELSVEELCRIVLAGEPVDPVTMVGPQGKDHTVIVRPLRDGSGEIVAALAFSRGEPLPAGEDPAVRYLANHDPLTGLYNRHAFVEAVGRQVAQASRYGCEGALLLVSLDDFAEVERQLGEESADAILFGVAEQLRERLRRTDILARLEGGEFAVLLPTGSRVEGEAVATALLDAVRTTPCARASLTASVGLVVLHDSPELTGEYVLHAADFAMYRAKSAGGDRFAIYKPPSVDPDH
jgi:diguanylate cyclase (GGDEF)-like protein